MNQLYIPIRTGTLLIPSGSQTDPDKKHLFIICTDPDEAGDYLLISISSFYNGCDETCILEDGEHGFINRKSFVEYRHPRIVNQNVLRKGVQDGELIPKDCMPPDPFQRICEGLLKSPHIALRYRNFYEAYLEKIAKSSS